jgi:hypothetical protein
LIEAEVGRIVEECHREADRSLAEHRDRLDGLARPYSSVGRVVAA